MREIKFRGQRVDNGEWVYGYYVYNGICEVHQIINNNLTYQSVIPETVGQYINIDDKDGTEIYEGDECKNGDWVQEGLSYCYRIEEVQWDEGNAMWFGWNPNRDGMSCEIIGNIFQNKETND